MLFEGGVVVGVSGFARRCGGLWRYLIVRAQGRTSVELERERTRATAEALRSMAGDCELLEYERDGRLRVIRRSGSPPASGPGGPSGPPMAPPSGSYIYGPSPLRLLAFSSALPALFAVDALCAWGGDRQWMRFAGQGGEGCCHFG